MRHNIYCLFLAKNDQTASKEGIMYIKNDPLQTNFIINPKKIDS